jgi:hypothetical protein
VPATASHHRQPPPPPAAARDIGGGERQLAGAIERGRTRRRYLSWHADTNTSPSSLNRPLHSRPRPRAPIDVSTPVMGA